jgi:hypothetical protein
MEVVWRLYHICMDHEGEAVEAMQLFIGSVPFGGAYDWDSA